MVGHICCYGSILRTPSMRLFSQAVKTIFDKLLDNAGRVAIMEGRPSRVSQIFIIRPASFARLGRLHRSGAYSFEEVDEDVA